MDEIRLLSAVLYLIAASLNLTKTIINHHRQPKQKETFSAAIGKGS